MYKVVVGVERGLGYLYTVMLKHHQEVELPDHDIREVRYYATHREALRDYLDLLSEHCTHNYSINPNYVPYGKRVRRGSGVGASTGAGQSGVANRAGTRLSRPERRRSRSGAEGKP